MSFPNFTFWSHLLATVGLEVCCLAALGFVAQRLFRPADWQRAAWQMTVICLLLLPASEWTGLGRGAAAILFGQKRVVEEAPASGFKALKSGIAAGPMEVNFNRPPAATRPPVWWPAWVWLAGTAIVLGRMAAAQVLLLALRLGREKIPTPSLRERVVSVANRLGLRRKVSLLLMPSAISPMAFGILRPSIGLPPGFEAKFSVTEQEAVLAHELAHLAAMDPLWFLLADFASALLWWHPLAWWARRSLHLSAELAADEAAALVPDGPGALAKCLVALGKEMTAARAWAWVGINGGFHSKLGKRVERLTRMSGGASRPLVGWVGVAAKTAATILVVPTVVLLFGSFQSAHGQKEDSWRGQLRESWNNSPGALLLLAALDDAEKQKMDIATRVKKAKLLYETGKYDESEAILHQVLKDDPTNRSAPYFLDLIKEARYMDRTRQREAGVKPIPGRQRILSKLQSITLNEVSYDLPLKDVLAKLRTESQKRDPEGVGVNFMVNQNVEPSGLTPPTNTGAPQRQGIGADVTIRISTPLTNLSLMDALDAIIIAADRPIRYTVEDFAVVFSPKPPEAAVLYTKVFRVDPNTFMRRLKSVFPDTLNSGTQSTGTSSGSGLQEGHHVTKTNSTLEAHQIVRAYFAAAGVDLTAPGKMVFFNDRLGELLVRATASDLEIIQHAIELLNQSPPQVMITARFVELPQEDMRVLGFSWYNTPMNNGASDLQGGTANLSGIFPKPDSSASKAILPNGLRNTATEANPTGIMTDPQFRVAINAIEQRTGEDILTAPKVTTESGRKAHLGVLDGNEGVALDVMAEVGPDGFSIATTAAPTIKMGHQTWQRSASLKLWDGQTMMLGGMTTNQPPKAGRMRMVFITPRIIDPAGNPVHTDSELSERPGIPDQ
jgi:beta-lactamase regulating signal transducer with metallopeptidase domain